MRIALARRRVAPGGGAERTVELLARGLAGRGHEVAVAAGAWPGGPPPGVELLAVEAGKGKAGARLFARVALAALAAWGPDTWLSLERVPGCPLYRAGDGVHAAWLRRRAPYRSGISRLATRLDRGHRALLELERETLAHPGLRLVIANSAMVAGELQAYHGLGPERVRVIYNAVDRQALAAGRDPATRRRLRAELGAEGSRPALLFMGSGFERKGLGFALAAVAGLPDVVLWVAGRDRPGAWLRLARRLGVAGRVRMLGTRGDAPALLGAADAMLLPTIYDPCANACLEALCLDLPVVTTAANGAGELVRAGGGGVVVEEPADAGALAEACRTALALERKGLGAGVPDMEQWLDGMLAVLEPAAGRSA